MPIRLEPTRALLWDDVHAVEIHSPLEGVLRLRHAPNARLSAPGHPELPSKRSYAVIAGDDGPLQTIQGPNGGALTASRGEVSVQLDEEGRAWTFSVSGEVRARCVEVRGGARVGYPVTDYRSALVLEAPVGEAYLGLGEKVGVVDKRGEHFVFWNTDVMPHQPDTDPLYASIPFLIAVRDGSAWGLFLDESARSEVDLARDDPRRLQWEVWGPELDLYLIAGPSPRDVLRRYTALTGRMPLPPLWSLGAHQSRWGYESETDLQQIVHGYRSRGLPLDAVHLDIDYQEGFKAWTWDRSRYSDPREVLRRAHEDHVRVITIVDPAVKQVPGYAVYEEALARNLLVREDRGDVLVGALWPEPCVFPDFSREDVQGWWATWHRSFLADGVDGIWNDMNEPSAFDASQSARDLKPPSMRRGLSPEREGPTLPFDARHGAKRHVEVHNVYGLGMAKASVEAFEQFAPERRPFVLTRAAYAGIQRYAAMWTGDNSSHWQHLEQSLPMLAGLGLSGVPFVGADIPGFLGQPSGELLVRWMQAGVFNPLMRNHSCRGTPPKEPWRFGEPWLGQAREALLRRYRLLPTIYTLMKEAQESGLPPLRPLALHFPEDREALAAYDQLLFGDGLLVAPVVRPGQTKRLAYLPRGRWLPFSNLSPAGAPLVEGGTHVIADAPLDVTPMWLREGSALVLTAPAMHTTTAWWPELDWHFAVGPELEARVYEDEGEGYGEFRDTRWRGGFDGVRLWLDREVSGAAPASREVDRLWLHGVPGSPASVVGARGHMLQDGALVLEVPSEATHVEVRW